MAEGVAAFRALALQTRCRAVNRLDVAAARKAMLAAVETVRAQIACGAKFIGPDVRLVVLPEYFLSGYPQGETIEEWRLKAALDPNGVEYDAMAKIASDLGIFLSGNAYETDAYFPGLYFQTSFLIDPTGVVVLRYRRLISMFAPTPHDIWDAYLDRYGLDGVFPVADTELGSIAAVASEEILYPEITRALALRGAEIILHSTGEIYSPELTPKDVAKRARAHENNVYVISANSGGIEGNDMPSGSTDGMSKIVDYNGRVLAEAGSGDSIVANAEIDIESLRRWRRRPGMSNMLSRQRTELFAPVYAELPIHPVNNLLGPDSTHTVPDRSHFLEMQREAIERLMLKAIIR